MTDQEKKLLGACLNGEKSAWDALVQQYSRLVYHSIKKTLRLYHVEPSSDIVEDLFQDFFLSLIRDDFRKLRQFRGERGTNLATWLRIIASRQTIDFLKKRATSANGAKNATDTLFSNHPDPSTSLLNQEQSRLLSQSLESLRPRDRLFVELYFYQSLPPEEIAKIRRVSTSAIYTQKNRVLKKLREALGRSGVL
jgi:RNA polymerase sigma-70 factor (ECF subfamily)